MKKYIKISCIGDILCEEEQLEVNYDKEKKKYDFNSNFSGIKKFLSNSDYSIANLETPLTKSYENLTNEPYAFNTPIEFGEAIKNSGIRFLTLANNHCLDRGIEGMKSTIDCLDSLKIEHTGTYKSTDEAIDKRVFIKEIENMKFAIISYTYGTNRSVNRVTLNKKNEKYVNLFRKQEKIIYKFSIIKRFKRKFLSKNIEDKFSFNRDRKYLKRVKEDVEYAKKNAEFVLFYMHSGGQYNAIPEDYTVKLMDYLIDLGVDIVVGMHPHVVQKIKKYKDNKWGIYSLGNLYAKPYVNINQKDELPNYSIILNLYFDTEKKKLDKLTFSMTKSIVENDKVFVKMAKDLIDTKKDNIIEEETRKIGKIFLDKDIQKVEEEIQIGGNIEKE